MRICRVVVHQHGFGDLDDDAFGADAVTTERGGKARRQRRLELQRREVDGEIAILHAGHAGDLGEVANRLFHDDVADADDLRRFLRDADDLGRRHQALLRMVEAHQRFETGNAAAGSRLTIGCRKRLEPVFDEAGLRYQASISARLRAMVEHGVVEELRTILAVALLGIHRHVGFLQQFGGVAAWRG
jgi:hypothetical protein